jgi:hypothetical protein
MFLFFSTSGLAEQACSGKQVYKKMPQAAHSWRAYFSQKPFRLRLFAARGESLPSKLLLRLIVAVHNFPPLQLSRPSVNDLPKRRKQRGAQRKQF